MGCVPIGCCRSLPKGLKGTPREVPSSGSEEQVSKERIQRRQKAVANLHVVEADIRGTRKEGRSGDDSSGIGSAPLSPNAASSQSGWNSSFSSSLRFSPMASKNSANKFMSHGTLQSQDMFMNPDQTIIIFDWDDTLCPTSHLRSIMNVNPTLSPEVQREVSQLADQVVPLLHLAMQLGKVVIVTNARRPWVETSRQCFIPACTGVMHGIPIMYAFDYLSKSKDFRPEQAKGEGFCMLTETKVCAMKAAITGFYSRYKNQSWKNIISIGDAFYEHDAIRQVAAQRLQTQNQRCRTKTVKLLEGPSIESMVVQLSILESWLTKIVQSQEDVDIDLSADEETINTWVQQFSPGPQTPGPSDLPLEPITHDV